MYPRDNAPRYNYFQGKKENSHGALFDFVGETQYDDPQVQFPRPISDEVIR